MRLEVFAVLKDYFASSFTLDKRVDSIHSLKQELMRMKPAATGVLTSCRFAVNNEFVQEDYKLNENDVISVLPPSSGG